MNSFISNLNNPTKIVGSLNVLNNANKVATTLNVLNNPTNISPSFDIYNPINKITNHISENITDFYEFLNTNKILATSIGIIIGLQINNLWNDLTLDFINPITKKILHKDLNDINICLFGVTLYVGKAIVSIINLLISFYFLYYIYKLSRHLGLK
jgi:large-conductance mechanosensitive channel